MTREAPQVLLLDEPTNHLDVDAREALGQALNAFDVAVVLVSHDPHLIALTAERLWLVADGTVASFEGDLEDYRRMLETERRDARAKARAGKPGKAAGGKSRKDQRRAGAEARAAVADLRKAAKQAEARIQKLTKEKAALEIRLADPEVYNGSTADLQALHIKFSDVTRALAQAEEDWYAAQAASEES
jgi:ATP-binding cassette subfamily F protein 3